MGQEAFAALRKERCGDLTFCRAALLFGWPAVDILESFNQTIKFLVTEGELISPQEFLKRMRVFIGIL